MRRAGQQLGLGGGRAVPGAVRYNAHEELARLKSGSSRRCTPPRRIMCSSGAPRADRGALAACVWRAAFRDRLSQMGVIRICWVAGCGRGVGVPCWGKVKAVEQSAQTGGDQLPSPATALP